MKPGSAMVLMPGALDPATLRSDNGDSAGCAIALLGPDRVVVAYSVLKTEQSAAACSHMSMWESHGSHFEMTSTLRRLDINCSARFNLPTRAEKKKRLRLIEKRRSSPDDNKEHRLASQTALTRGFGDHGEGKRRIKTSRPEVPAERIDLNSIYV